MKKIIVINLIIVFFVFCTLEFVSYLHIRHDAGEFLANMKKLAKENGGSVPSQRYAPVKIYDQNSYEEHYRKTWLSTDKNKGSILFFGCSYTYGSHLNEDETLPAIINKRTNRTTINRGIEGGGIYNTIHDLKNEKFYEKLSQEPQYIIYTYINDHLNRIITPYKGSIIFDNKNPVYYLNFGYKEKNGELIDNTPSKFIQSFYTLYTVKAYYYLFANKFANKEEKMLMLMKEAKKITDKKFPNSKFIIIDYKDGGHVLMNDYIKQNLIESNFILLNAEELAGHELDSDKWRGPDKEHPSAEAFEDVATGLIKELNL